MLKTPMARAISLATLGATLAIPSLAQAAFIEDSKATLELRNFYMNRDFRDAAPGAQSKAEEWAQGFILRYESGFTEGDIGFGVDAIGLLGVKLDSGPGRAGTGILPGGFGDDVPDEYSQLGAAAKAKISNSTLRAGTLMPKLPSVSANDSRLLPQTFQGFQLTSQEINGLTLNAGRLYQNSLRNLSRSDDIAMNAPTGARGITGATAENEFWFAGGSFAVDNNLTLGYNYGNLDQNYKQHIVNAVHVHPISEGQSFKTDLRFARSTDDGNTNVDNNAFGAMFTYAISGHAFGLAYQKMNGDTGYAYLAGTDPFLVNYVQISDFANPGEKSWQARYDYNFAAMGIPGLTFMTRYITGDGFQVGGASAKEWERNTDIGYVFQDGALKNLGVRLRNATLRRSYASDMDENRLIVSYTLPLM
ncbi:OprD family porin [Stutzerimonas tarimensis]|uniref:OprD family porin n=1 Tax=Stutzerimonas tarimensis TaxID=1507735 RepID=A0ABV7T666_9GAMM